jgi:hypothetical protein
MVRMTCLGQFVIDCNDRDSIFELGCALFLEGAKAASFAEFCRFRGQVLFVLELNNAMRLQPIE